MTPKRKLIVQVVEQMARGSKASAKQIWQHLERWARQLQCKRIAHQRFPQGAVIEPARRLCAQSP